MAGRLRYPVRCAHLTAHAWHEVPEKYARAAIVRRIIIICIENRHLGDEYKDSCFGLNSVTVDCKCRIRAEAGGRMRAAGRGTRSTVE